MNDIILLIIGFVAGWLCASLWRWLRRPKTDEQEFWDLLGK